MKIVTLIFFVFFTSAHAGYVEPCSKWETLPVKICRGTKGIYSKYNRSLDEDHKSARKFSKDFKKLFSKLDVVTSNKLYPEQDDLWNLAKKTIGDEFTNSKTGIYFDFIDTEDLTQCDSVLFFTDGLNGFEGISSIGDRANKKNITNKDQKTPSFTMINIADEAIQSASVLTEDDKNKFLFSFKNTLVHEVGHLAGLVHTHNYKKQYNNFFMTQEAFKESKTAVDVCGMDPYSIMGYDFISWLEDSGNVLWKLPENRKPQDIEGCRLSENDMKSLRCLYGTEPDCKIECKKK